MNNECLKGGTMCLSSVICAFKLKILYKIRFLIVLYKFVSRVRGSYNKQSVSLSITKYDSLTRATLTYLVKPPNRKVSLRVKRVYHIPRIEGKTRQKTIVKRLRPV